MEIDGSYTALEALACSYKNARPVEFWETNLLAMVNMQTIQLKCNIKDPGCGFQKEYLAGKYCMLDRNSFKEYKNVEG